MKTILLVEDDPFIVDIYATEFKREGFAVEVAMDGVAALEAIKNHHPDMVLLDIILPKMDGWEFLKVLRGDAAIRHIKVMVISNLNQQDYTREIEQFGVIKYFLKIQTTPEEIVKAVKETLT
ncbi:MAG: hypothetical protein A3D44_01745 [Candidatus Staskawiczbacteria bacterium RIFCSPHIGHO2_02_FULL_42_22]|uniref:Response regulatory domain-containing protein n=1 Tax=Candidatus Staskawiczbacteria bacterium RIFCSPHIGHO2_02_FULL_42_22 TaxID=1802207 RepID=A0A1G2I0P0_9BACT|nr:MAG: hypothetical protein A3D44_01745 [Candidatus Staskawiczbacteria bacterium RIFCSPHIGHO2_02_FULL_42_22]